MPYGTYGLIPGVPNGTGGSLPGVPNGTHLKKFQKYFFSFFVPKKVEFGQKSKKNMFENFDPRE